MRNDSIETLLLRHYGSSAPVPVDLEQQISALIRQETVADQTRQQVVNNWHERRVSRRKLLQLVTLSGGASLSVLAVGLNTLKGGKKPAYSV